MQFFQTPNIDFIAKRKIAYFISLGLFVVGLVSMILHGGPNLGIDFKGGTSIQLRFNTEIDTQDIRDALSDIGLGTSEIKSIGAAGDFLIYVEQQRGVSASDMTNRVIGAITEAIPDVQYELMQTETVGPKIGDELRKAVILAVLVALLLILIYIGWRFELVFAVGAIIALFHDVIITLGIFSLMNYELSLKEIAAFLTIVGYSLNDTIVVYDRARENLKVLRSDDLGTIMNKSINQVLSRTIITSLTTFFVVLILFIFGGAVIKGFAFTMLIGVIVGTYSSIFVASPVILEWQMRHGGKRELKMAKKRKR